MGTKILRDVNVILDKGKKRMTHLLRIIETIDNKGNNLVPIITNRFDLSTEEVRSRLSFVGQATPEIDRVLRD
ncbi:hypothetical protein [Paenibacillus andongensis]|uniref:hypothetical protein n=1 Tax=Paenibacillus andongensis TaxID=2975482 RepID=UPI0021BB0443|nr:hypothetical protein [Paenibacillus andongensis]